MMAKTRVLKSGDDFIVLIPDELAFPDGAEIEINRSGDVITIRLVDDKAHLSRSSVPEQS